MDSNIAESWNNVIKEAREYPIICMLEYIRTQVMSWYAMRREKAARETGNLAPKVREIVEENFEESTTFGVKPIGHLEFEVQSTEGASHIVNLDAGTCSCMKFQILGIPCSHAIAAACRSGFGTDAMVNDCFYVNSLVNGYVGKMYPIPSVGGQPLGRSLGEPDFDTLPPKSRRPPGRPRKLRVPSRGEFKVIVRKFNCSC